MTNCDDGILLENLGMHNIIIEGITFQCANSGILAIGTGQYSNQIRRGMLLRLYQLPVDGNPLRGNFQLMVRITSYNVCYMKLLRKRSFVLRTIHKLNQRIAVTAYG